MKKVIKLTESDLVKLVKKVMSEQATAPTRTPSTKTQDQNQIKSRYEKLLKPINIKMGRNLFDVTHKKGSVTGCYFGGNYKGQTAFFIEYLFSCNDKSFKSKSQGEDMMISPQAKELLLKECGCQAYVKNDATSGGQYV